jgi:DNA-binding winged helix-turn-helix (wHTH) protein
MPRVDELNECIWWGERRVDLAPMAILVLRRLMQQPNQIVPKAELLDAAWPDTHVGEGVLTLAVNQLRDALGDDPRQPRFIETVHRRGYRWIGADEGSRKARGQ